MFRNLPRKFSEPQTPSKCHTEGFDSSYRIYRTFPQRTTWKLPLKLSVLRTIAEFFVGNSRTFSQEFLEHSLNFVLEICHKNYLNIPQRFFHLPKKLWTERLSDLSTGAVRSYNRSCRTFRGSNRTFKDLSPTAFENPFTYTSSRNTSRNFFGSFKKGFWSLT